MPRPATDVRNTARNIIAEISRSSELVFHLLHEVSHRMADYAFLVRELPRLDVSTDEYYQRRYNSFYVVRRNRRWCGHFYDLLQRKKCEAKVTFAEVIHGLHHLTKRVEPSFSSKLVATIRPDPPTYDVEVCRHMNVSVPPRSIHAEQRIEMLIVEYDRMIGITACAVKTPEFEALAKRFDQQFHVHETFTNSKKLDLML